MKTIYPVASGDQRLEVNRTCEAAQAEMEKQVVAAVEHMGGRVQRAHLYDPMKQHAFIDRQITGMKVFRTDDHCGGGLSIHTSCPAGASHPSRSDPDGGRLQRHMAGLRRPAEPRCLAHQGGGVKCSSLWSEDFMDDSFFGD